MKALALTRAECHACLITLGMGVMTAVIVFAVTNTASDIPAALCPATVSIMTTTVADIICR